MKNFLKRHDILTRLLAIVIAVGLWGFVATSKDLGLERGRRFSIPVTLSGQDLLLRQHGLAVISGQDTRVTVDISGKTGYVWALKDTDIRVNVDISSITEAGTYENLPYEVALPASASTFKITRTKPDGVTLIVDTVETRDIPVTVVLDGDAPSGYLYDTPQPDADSVAVTGPSSLLDTVGSAQVTVPVGGVKQTLNGRFPFVFVNQNGEKMDASNLRCTKEDVGVTMHVNHTKSVPLRLALRPSAEITEDMATVTIDPTEVQVYGDESALNDVESLSLGVLDLGREQTGAEITRSIRLPEGVELVRGQPSEAKITLRIDGMTTSTVNISNITLVDLNAATEKPPVKLVTASIEVSLRGKSSTLNSLSLSDIRASAQFDSSTLTDGVHSVSVSVTLPTSEVTVLDYTKQIEIQVGPDPGSTDEPEPTPEPPPETDPETPPEPSEPVVTPPVPDAGTEQDPAQEATPT